MSRLEQRLSRLEKRMGVGASPPDPPQIYIREFDCHASEAEMKAILGDEADWITCRQQIEAAQKENMRRFAENPAASFPPIVVTASPRREFEARGLPMPGEDAP